MFVCERPHVDGTSSLLGVNGEGESDLVRSLSWQIIGQLKERGLDYMSSNDEKQENNSLKNADQMHLTTGSPKIKTSYDEQGRSWVEIDADINELEMSEWIGGIPDVWKRR